jgi:hypothetical protein
MRTEGIKINCLGASNTRIVVTDGRESVRDVNYPVILGLLLRCTVRNYGVCGSCVALTGERTDSYLERLPAMDRDADVVILQGWGNDNHRDVPLGSPGDRCETSYRGALALCIERIRLLFPDAKLLVLSGLDRRLPPRVRPDGLTIDDFIGAFFETCRRCGAEPHDFFRDPLIRAADPSEMPDGVHMSETACRHYAEVTADLIKEL